MRTAVSLEICFNLVYLFIYLFVCLFIYLNPSISFLYIFITFLLLFF